MKTRLFTLLCFATAAVLRGSPIPFSGSGPSGSIGSGEEWSYSPPTSQQTDEYSWGMPGAGKGTTTWLGSQTVSSFEITFNLPKGVSIDPTILLPCGSDFCSQDGNTFKGWTSTLISTDTILFTDGGGATPLVGGTSFFVDIFFTEKVTDAAFSGAWNPAASTATPEPDCFLLVTAGLLGLVGLARRKRLS